MCAAVFSCKAGVRRAHLVDYSVPGALLLELYTFDGIGAMVSRDRYEGTRPAKPGDWIHIKTILEPLAAEGTTVAVSDDARHRRGIGGEFLSHGTRREKSSRAPRCDCTPREPTGRARRTRGWRKSRRSRFAPGTETKGAGIRC